MADFDFAWSDNVIVGTGPGGVWAVPDTGGTLQTLLALDPTVEVARKPLLIDNGRRVLFTRRLVGDAGPAALSIVVRTVGQDDGRVIVEAGQLAGLLPTGHLAYVPGRDLSGDEGARLPAMPRALWAVRAVVRSGVASDCRRGTRTPRALARVRIPSRRR